MITIDYCPTGEKVSDFEYKTWLEKVRMASRGERNDEIFSVANSVPIKAVQLAIALGDINCCDVRFLFGDKYFSANRFGAIVDWPEGFADVEVKLSEDILRCAMARRKIERFSETTK
jgi:hypothetical protein